MSIGDAVFLCSFVFGFVNKWILTEWLSDGVLFCVFVEPGYCRNILEVVVGWLTS